MCIGLKLYLLNELNKSILCEPLAKYIILFNEFNKFSNEPIRILYCIYHISLKKL